MQLVKYDAARKALAEARRIDEAKDIRDKAVAFKAYAMQAKDAEMVEHATEIKMRAEIRAGELLREMEKADGGDAQRTRFQKGTESPATLKELGVTKKQSSSWQKIASLPQPEQEQKIARAKAKARRVIEGQSASTERGTIGTDENEWYTPVEYIEAARAVLGEIDLDPASSDFAQKVIRAKSYFTKAQDGLTKEWFGRVWLNPPFAQPFIANFAAKIVAEVMAGRVPEAIMVTNNYSDTAWFHLAASVASAICFTRGRVKFYNQYEVGAQPTQGQTFFYFGDKPDRFTSVFRQIGFVTPKVLPFIERQAA
jgi:hypothetical protein